MGCGVEIEANSLLTSLVAGEDFSVPVVNLDSPEFQLPGLGDLATEVVRLTNQDLTSGVVGGTGTFDVIMAGVNAHLKTEYDKGRITGEQYSKVYIALTESALSNSVQFLLGRDQAYWQAVTARLQAMAAQAAVVAARVQLETAKVDLQTKRFEALTQKSTFALTKMKLATESVGYCIAEYNLTTMLPAQLQLVQEQKEAQRAQTMDTRSDGLTPITGQIGKQKDLYSQQITSYQRDSEIKAAKLYTDAWITMKTLDEALLAPTGFTNANLDVVLTAVQTNNNLA